MSANDYVGIKRVGKEYIVSHLDFETDWGQELRRFKSLMEAVTYAEDYVQEFGVEYGIRFKNVVGGK